MGVEWREMKKRRLSEDTRARGKEREIKREKERKREKEGEKEKTIT